MEPDELPDLTESVRLARRARDGDRAALDALFAAYQGRLRRIIRVRMGPLARLEESTDVLQDALHVAWQKVGDVEPESAGSILRWLEAIATNQIRNRIRFHNAEKRDRRRDGAVRDDSAAVPPAPDTAPGERVSRSELREIVDDEVHALIPPQRDVVLLRDYYAEGWEQTARELGRSVHAAEQLYQRARSKLRGRLARRLGEGAGG